MIIGGQGNQSSGQSGYGQGNQSGYDQGNQGGYQQRGNDPTGEPAGPGGAASYIPGLAV